MTASERDALEQGIRMALSHASERKMTAAMLEVYQPADAHDARVESEAWAALAAVALRELERAGGRDALWREYKEARDAAVNRAFRDGRAGVPDDDESDAMTEARALDAAVRALAALVRRELEAPGDDEALWREYEEAREEFANSAKLYQFAGDSESLSDLARDRARLDAAVRALAAAPPAPPAVADGDVTLGIKVVQDAIPYHDSPAEQRALRALLRAVRQTDALRQIVREYKEGHGAAEGGVDSAGVAVDVDACRCALCEDARRALAAALPAEPREREDARLRAIEEQLDDLAEAVWRAAAEPKCVRCGHPKSWHRHNDAKDDSLFRCIGYDCAAPGSPKPPCGCPDFLAAAPREREEA